VSKAVEITAGADVVAVLDNRKQHGHIEWPARARRARPSP
jgi:hypothetical protein